MAKYDYINDDTGEVREVVQLMSEKHCYFDENGKEWRRIFYSPQMAVDPIFHTDPHDAKSYVEKSRNKKGTIGNLIDESAALSEARKGNSSHDHIKEEYYVDYAKKRSGQKHNDVKQREVKSRLDKLGISITPD